MRENNLPSNELLFDARIRLREREYWLNHLSGELVKSHFPFDRVKKPFEAVEGPAGLERVNFSFTGETFTRLMKLSNQSDIRLYIILLAGVMVLLEKYTGNPDIIVGSPIYRQESDSDLINKILPIRTQVHGYLSFKELLLRTSKINSDAVANINYPIESLPYELNLTVQENEFPLFDIGVLVENIHEKSYIDHLNLNVVFCFKRVDESVEGVLEYHGDLYHGETMERICSHYINLMQQALFGIDTTLGELSILSREEKQRLLFDLNDSHMDYPDNKTIHELFEEQVERTPGDIALIGKGLSGGEPVGERRVLTYRQLNETANRFARILRIRGLCVENISAVLMERSLEQIIALLAILKAGGAYLPIDIEYPAQRINYLLQDSDAKLLLTTGVWIERVEFGGAIVDVGDEGLFRLSPGDEVNLGVLSGAGNLAYVIYTSGTTGKPKGVMIEHGSVVNYIWWAARTYVREEARHFPLYSSISFDLTVTSLFTPLVTGNAIVVYSESDSESGDAADFLIERIIEENRVDVVKLTPSHLYVLKYKDLSHWQIKCFIVGGEELDTGIARQIHTRFSGNIEIYNEYGPTEATVGCICYRFDPARDTGPAVPIGQPAGNVRVYILDINQGLVPSGAVGEIYIGGEGVARGYVNKPGLTAEKFVRDFWDYRDKQSNKKLLRGGARKAQSPGRKAQNAKRHAPYAMRLLPGRHRHFIRPKHALLYRTGDLARWLEDGNIEFLGRVDQQVKIRGYRIELGEIEQRLLEHKNIKEVVVLAGEFTDQGSGGQKTDPYLCAYVVASEEFEASSLREYLLQRLPDYMVPLFFIQVAGIPLTSNGKVDPRALPEPKFSPDREYTAPRNEIELKLAEIWSEILGMESERISIDANFFELGGHSLRQVMLISHIHREFNVRISLATVFKIPSIRGLSGYIKDSSKTGYSSIVQVEEKEYYPVSSAQKRIFFVHGLDNTGINYNVPIVLELEGELDREKFNAIIRALIKRHESLRTSFKMIGEDLVQQVHSSDAVEFQPGCYPLAAYSEKTNRLKRADSPGLKVGSRPGEKEEEGYPVLKPLFGEADPEVEKIIKKKILRPFDLSHAPLLRLAIIEISKREYILVIDMHHIITDGTSQNILEQEIISLYSTPGSQLQPLQLRYKDFSEWENSGERRQTIKQQESYWFKEFCDIDELPVFNLPTDYPRPLIQGFEGNWVNFGLNHVETKILKNIGEENGATLYMVLLAVFNILFSKLSGQEDIVLGTPLAARRHPELQQVVGMMVNTLAMRNYPAVNKTFTGFLQEVKQRTLKAFENQEYPFENLVDHLALDRDTSRNPLFDVMLNLLSQAEYRGEIASADDHPPYRHIEAVTRFDLTFYAVDLEESMTFLLEYSSRIFSPTTIERFIKYLKTIIINLPANTDRALADITIISAEEKEEILKICAGEEREYDKSRTIHTLFQEQAALTPDQVAVVRDMGDEEPGGHSLTYKALNQRSNQLAHLLRSKGVGPNTIVGIVMEPCIERVIAIIGILKAGGAYLPIDPQYPAKRILSILEDSQCYFLLTAEAIKKRFDFNSLESLKSVHVNPHVTGKRGQIKDLNSLPFPNRTYVSYEKYHQCIGIAMARHTVSIQATRGCPFKCAYCHKIWPKTHMVRSAENIFQEMKHLHEAGIKRFVFVDDTFNLNRKNAEKFLEMVIKYLPGLQFFFPNGLRGDILDKEFIDLLVEAGTINIAVALENPSPRLQEMMFKRLKLERFSEMVHYLTRKHPQVILEMQLMIGFPTETQEETLNLLDFIKKFKWLHFPNLHVLKIYPNTDMYRLALEHGVSASAIDASTSYAYHELPETLPYSRHFAKQFQTRFMDEYMLCKERLLHVLPYQLKSLTREELIQKYNSYFPEDIRTFADILRMGGISASEFPEVPLLENDCMAAPHFREKLAAAHPVTPDGADADTMRILLLDLSQLFTPDAEGLLYDMVEAPLGLMYLMTYLDKQFQSRVKGKIAKSRVDFDSFQELKELVTGFNPHLIGLRTLSYFKNFYHQTLWHLRYWGVDVPIICGGPYASSDYPQMLQDHHITLAVIGEGELTMAELVEKMLANNKKLPPEEELMEIPGLAFIKREDRPVLGQNRRKIIALDKVGTAGSSPGVLSLAAYPVSNLENLNQPGDLLYLISTSGSTDQPKSVMLEHRNLVNLMQFQFSLPGLDFTHVLQFASIGFDVSAQEIFSTLLSGGKLFLLSGRKKYDIPWLLDYIERNGIKVLFLPPAFLTFVFSEPGYAEGFPKCVKHIIAAGEQLVVMEPFRKYLKDNRVVLHNHYGPTETHVVSSLVLNPTGEIPELPSIGKPICNTMLYILDEKRELKPVGVPGELYISGDNVGRGYYNREKQTRENFIPDPFFPGYRMYRSGDLARWLPDKNIEFLGRKDQQVKIRGFRIELGEIEKILLNRIDIKKAVVIAREREEGAEDQRYLCAYFVSDTEVDTPELINHLSRELPDYMVPSYFERLKEIPLTASGKIDRRALPSPEVKAGEEYAPPRNELEEKMVDIWSQVLQVDKDAIGIDSDFFQLGGHSLKATAMVARIHKELDVELPLAEVLKSPDIRDLSHRIGELTQHKYVSIKAVEKKDYYPLSSAQKRLYILQRMDKEGIAYNLPYVSILEGNLDKVWFEESFRGLIERHESLRTSFLISGKQPVQRIHDTVEFFINYYEKPVDAEWPSGIGDDNSGKEGVPGVKTVEALVKDFIRPFVLSMAPLLRVRLVKSIDTSHILMVDMHHTISDGTSINVLIKDFTDLYKGDMPFPVIRITYKDFSQWQNRPARKKLLASQEAYWLKEFTGEIPVLNLPTDYSRPVVQGFEGRAIHFEMDEKKSRALKSLARELDVTLFMLLLCVYTVFLSKLSGQEDIVVGTPIAGRKHADLESIIGMFVNTLVLRNFPRGTKPFTLLLEEVKERALAAFENQDYLFEDLVERVEVERDTSRNPLFDTMFSLQNFVNTEIEIPGLKLKPYQYENRISKFDLLLQCTEKENQLLFTFEYSTQLFASQTIEGFRQCFEELMAVVLENPGIPMADIDIPALGELRAAASPLEARDDALSRSDKPGIFMAPRTDIERQLAAIWGKILEKEKISITADFFEESGNSIKALLVITEVNEAFEVNLLITHIFEHRTIEQFALLFADMTRQSVPLPSIENIEEREYYELSHAQRRLWVLCQMEQGSVAYNMPAAYLLSGPLNRHAFGKALEMLVERHESMRTVFIIQYGEPKQKVVEKDRTGFAVEQVDLRPYANRWKRAERMVHKEAWRVFDLKQGPLMSVQLLQLEDERFLFLYNMHHIISDGWSLGVVIKEVTQLYQAFIDEQASTLSPLEIRYKDFSAWQNRQLAGEELTTHRNYWWGKFKPGVPVLEIPCDYSRPKVKTYNGDKVDFSLGPALSNDLEDLALRQDASLFIILLASVNALLFRYTGQEDIVVGSPLSGRQHKSLENQVGYYVNTLALRNTFRGSEAFEDLVARVKETVLAAFEHEIYPFDQLVDDLNLEHDTSRSPLFDVMVALNPEIGVDLTGGLQGITIESYELNSNISKFDLLFMFFETNKTLNGIIEFNTDLFSRDRIERLRAHYVRLVKETIISSQSPLTTLDYLSKEEKHQLLVEFNDIHRDYPHGKTIYELFAEQVVCTANGIALTGGTGQLGKKEYISLSYKELNKESTQVAKVLLEKGVKPGTIVAIMVQRSIEMIIGILGILKAGGAYLPLNAESPQKRINYMLIDSSAKVLLAAAETQVYTEVEVKEGSIEQINISNLLSFSTLASTLASTPTCQLSPTNLAYVIYTSGSTGKPKGVPITHSNFSTLVHWGYQYVDIGPGDRTLQNLSYYFDWSVWEIFITLTTGAGLYMALREVLFNSEACIAFINTHALTVLHITPSQYSYLVNTAGKTQTLRYLFIGAEKLTYDLVQRSFDMISSQCRVFNMYGPTEATIITAAFEIHRQLHHKNSPSVPIGRPAGSTRLLILDKYLNLCPVNIPGELYIAGDCLSHGYLNNANLTHDRFIKNPFANKELAIGNLTLYRTGDLTRWLEDGNIEFLGRIDHQVKIRGMRIELGEIEARLSGLDGIKETIVLALANEQLGKYLCAYIVSDRQFEIQELRENLSKELPNYMIPSHFMRLDEIPLNPNGKVDRKALPVPGIQVGENYTAPRNPIEEKLADIWAEVLAGDELHVSQLREVIGLDNNFFELGGHSLKATLLTSRIYKEFDIQIPFAQLFKTPTIRGIAEFIIVNGWLDSNPDTSQNLKEIEL